MSYWLNADGITVPFGADWRGSPENSNKVSSESVVGLEKEVIINVDFTKIASGTVSFTTDRNNDGTNDGFSERDLSFPPNASIVNALLYSTETAVGGTSFTIGTYQLDGTEVAATGIFTATEGVIANLTLGKRTYGAGTLMSNAAGTGGSGTTRTYVGISTTGTFTAGKAKLRIKYIGGV